MSKNIWHFPSEAPAYCFLCVFENSFDGEVHCGHYNPGKKQFCSTEGRYEINQVKRYCDLLHLLDCEQELIRTRKALDKGMEHITGLNNMIESWYKLLQSDKDASTKYAILKSAISAYVENKGGDNE